MNDLKLTLKFNADTKSFVGEVKVSEQEVKKFGQSSGTSATKVKDLGDKTRTTSSSMNTLRGDLIKLASGFAALLGLRAMKGMIEQQAQLIDQTAKHADKLGITTEALTQYRYAAELTGVGSNNLDTSLQRMTRRIADAAQGAGEAAPALRQLGLDAQQLARMTPEEQLKAVADGFQNVQSQSERVRLAFKLFDTEGVAMVNMLEGGSAGLNAMAAEADQLGISLSRIDAAKVEAANDAMFKVNETTRASIQAFTVELAPAIGGLADLFVDYAKQNGGLNQVMAVGIQMVVTGVGYLGNAFRGIQLIIKAIEATWLGFKANFMVVVQAMTEALHNLGAFIFKSLVSPLQGILDLAGTVSDEAQGMADKLRTFSDMPPPVIFDPVAINNARLEANQAIWELRDLASKPLPKEGIEQWYKDVRAKFDDLAKARADVLAGRRNESQNAPVQPPANQKTTAIDAYFGSSDKLNNEFQKRLAIQADYQNKAAIEENYAYEQRQAQLTAQFQAAWTQAKGNQDLMLALNREHNANLEVLAREHEMNLTEIKRKAEQERFALQMQNANILLGSSSQMFDGLAGLAEAYGGKQSAAYRTLFAISKGFAVAQAGLNLALAISNASAAQPWYMAIPAIAQATAQGASVIASLKSTSYQGQAHDGIDRVPRSNEGTWLLKANEMVLNPAQADNFRWMVTMMNQLRTAMTVAQSGGQPANDSGTVVNIYGSNAQQATSTTRTNSAGQKEIDVFIDTAVERVKQELYADADNGGPITTRIRQSA